MIKVGECYYHKGVSHIVIASANYKDKFLILSITSSNFDKSCEINENDIIDNNGKQILEHTSYVCYKFAFEFKDFRTYEDFRKIYDYRCDISKELLNKIQDGARKSKYLEHKFKKYFE